MPVVFIELKKRMLTRNFVALVFFSLIIENSLDYVFTMNGISSGIVEEANAITAFLINNGLLWIFKILTSVILVMIGKYFYEKPQSFTKLSLIAVISVTTMYTALLVYHLIIQYHIFYV
jgi:hypothetical protein